MAGKAFSLGQAVNVNLLDASALQVVTALCRMRNLPEPYFSRILFYQLSQTAALCGPLAELRASGVQVEVLFAATEGELLSRLSEQTLVVARDPQAPRLLSLLYSHGLPFCVSREFFEHRAYQLFQLYRTSNHGEVMLAFLSLPRETELKQLFSLYGFQVSSVRHPGDFPKVLPDSLQFCVIDQDLPPVTQKKNEVRARIFKQLKAHRAQNPLFAIAAIKDFNQGSLFEDILSPVKELCNSLLSPEEFFLFIRGYLFRYETEIRRQKIRKLKNENFFGEKMNFGYYLRDIRKVHGFLNSELTRENVRLLEQAMRELHLMELRHLLTEPIARYLESLDGEKRGTFEFIQSAGKEPKEQVPRSRSGQNSAAIREMSLPPENPKQIMN